MKVLFYLCFALVVYAYFGYLTWLWLFSYFYRRPVSRKHITLSVSIVIAARNEEMALPAKLDNLRHLDYPADCLQIIVASDGSTDNTPSILLRQVPYIIPVIIKESQGKAVALNEGVKRATGEILVFLDTRQSVDSNAVSELVSCFSDPTVGAVSGELLLDADPNSNNSPMRALGTYWKIEKAIRKLESASGSVVGVTGAIYAIRRELYTEIPQGTILDDVFIPMYVVRMGKRVVFQPSAIARDLIFNKKGKEFSRKVRTLTGNYQLLRLAPWLLSRKNPLLFRFVSHKLLRLVSPLLLVLMLVSSVMARGLLYRAIFGLQALFYVLAAVGILSPPTKKFRAIAIADTFVMLNAAAVVAFFSFIVRRRKVWL